MPITFFNLTRMTTRYKLDNFFGLLGDSTGWLLFIAGLCMLYFSLVALILVIAGALLAFSRSVVLIDAQHKRVRLAVYLFGFIRLGKWVAITPQMWLGITKTNKAYTLYSRGGCSTDVPIKDYRIILHDGHNKSLLPLYASTDIERVKSQLHLLGEQLQLSVTSS